MEPIATNSEQQAAVNEPQHLRVGSQSCTLLHAWPAVARTTQEVVGWECRVGFSINGEDGFNDFWIEVQSAERRPVAQWSQPQLEVAIVSSLRESKKFRDTIELINFRSSVRVDRNFSLTHLQGERHGSIAGSQLLVERSQD